LRNNVFKDLLVLDFTQSLAGPYCTMLMANNGARVIKIERIDGGDLLRGAAPFDPEDNISLFWASVNSNKESCVLDLKNPDDLIIIKNIIKKADVVVENFRPGVMDRLGLGYKDVCAIKPDIVYTSISGFGHTGPLAKMPGFDLVGQGISGMMTVNGDLEKDEGRVGFPIGDVTSGMWAYMATITGLCHRFMTGEPSYCDISMLDGLFAMLPAEVLNYTKANKLAHPSGNHDPCSTPFGVIKTSDGAIIVAVLGGKLWVSFCEAIGRTNLINHDLFKTSELRLLHRADLSAIVRPIIKTKTTQEWVNIFTNAGVPNGLVNNIKDTCELPQIEAREMLVHSGKYTVAGNPIKIEFNGKILCEYNPPEKLGQSTAKIKTEFK
jgi:CoA:oxalate CoA-transferase